MLFGKETKQQLKNAEARELFYYTKLWNIAEMITSYENGKGLNPHYLIKSIKNELDRPLHQI